MTGIADLFGSDPTVSFEFFPSKTEEGRVQLVKCVDELAAIDPTFVSVTYGAGGTTRTRTIEIVSRIKRELGIEPMAHLTCVGATRDDLARVLDQLADADVHNILALRGDPPQGQNKFEVVAGGLRYADELVAFVRDRGPFCVGAACYPELHPEAPDAQTDLKNLKRKVDAGVDFLISQLFFDNNSFHAFEQRAREAGIRVPILPGIMPITNFEQIHRFSQMCGATIPTPLRTRLESIADDPQEVFWAGVSYAAHQCRNLLQPAVADPFTHPQPGVPGIHFYTLNKSPATRAIFEILQLSRACYG